MIRRVAVIVPAADEQDRIAACLSAIERARRELLGRSSGIDSLGIDQVDVIVVLDDCHDNTAAVVADFARRQPVRAVVSSARCVGSARRLGTQSAIDASDVEPDQLWLANTDADSRVPSDWLTQMVDAANTGAQLVLGTVLPGEELAHGLRMDWLAAHESGPGHPHIHGANLGLRADTYLELGGWRERTSDEDVDLVARAVAAGNVEIARSGSIAVMTSARMAGRAPRGFSSYLRQLRDIAATATAEV